MSGALVVQADALRLPLPDASVDLIVTSPPYFALRAYDGPTHQIGSEPTPQLFLEALWAATAEMARVLKPSGSMFVDLGDKYNSAQSSQNGTGKTTLNPNRGPKMYNGERGQVVRGIPAKSLLLLPERYRVGCVDRLGLIARAVIVWQKPNGLPESVTDRVRRSHGEWVHLVKQPRYYSAIDEIREPHTGNAHPAGPRAAVTNWESGKGVKHRTGRTDLDQFNPLGKLPGSVWSVPSEPLRLPDHLGVDHYAAFPSEWPRRLILGWSPPRICVECETGRGPVVEKRGTGRMENPAGWSESDSYWPERGVPRSRTTRVSEPEFQRDVQATILGYACACTPHTNHPGTGGTQRRDYSPGLRDNNAQGTYGRHQAGEYHPVGPWREYHIEGWRPPPTRPAVVLDPFGGTGTTSMVARALGRVGLSFDLSHAYSRAARWRIRYDAAKAISRTNLERQGSLL